MVEDGLRKKWEHLQPWDDKVRTALAAGDRHGAWDALIQGYQHVVVGYCSRWLGDRHEGEEVAQEVFLNAYEAIERFQQKASVRTWLFAIARKTCMKHSRWTTRLTRLVSRHRDQLGEAVHADPPASPEAAWLDTAAENEQEIIAQQWSNAFKRLPKRDKALLMMRYDEELPYRTIATKLWISESAVRRHIQAATERLKQLKTEDKGIR